MSDTVHGTDQWGVPTNMFEPVPEDFYGVVGRITSVSALAEQRLHDLYCALADQPQDVHAGAPGTFMIKKLRERVRVLPLEHHDQVRALVADAEAALAHRHEVVHNLWPHSGSPSVSGWHGAPSHKRRDPNRAVE